MGPVADAAKEVTAWEVERPTVDAGGLEVGARVGGAVGLIAMAVTIGLTIRPFAVSGDLAVVWRLTRRRAAPWVLIAFVGLAALIYVVCLFGLFVVPLPLMIMLGLWVVYRFSIPRG